MKFLKVLFKFKSVSHLLYFWLPKRNELYRKTEEKFMSQMTTLWFLKLVFSATRIWKAFYLSVVCQPLWYLSAVEIIIAKINNRTNSKQEMFIVKECADQKAKKRFNKSRSEASGSAPRPAIRRTLSLLWHLALQLEITKYE